MTKIYIPVPVSERLPSKSGSYICEYTYNHNGLAFRPASYIYFDGNNFDDTEGDVTHWLEERGLPSEEEIKQNCETEKNLYPQGAFIAGAN